MAPSLETSSLPGLVPPTNLAHKGDVAVSVSSVTGAEEHPVPPKFELEDHAIDDVPALKVRYVG